MLESQIAGDQGKLVFIDGCLGVLQTVKILFQKWEYYTMPQQLKHAKT